MKKPKKELVAITLNYGFTIPEDRQKLISEINLQFEDTGYKPIIF